MTKDEIGSLIRELLGAIAPEADFDALGDDEELREALDIDSMDFLNFVTALNQRTGVEIAEKDYAGLASMNDIVAFLSDRGC